MEAMIHSRRRRTGRWTLLSGIALVAVGVLSFNAYADFTGTTSFDQPASTGTMMLDKANEAIKAYNLPGPGEMAPGDTMQRGLLLSVSGTVSASSITLAAADAAPTVLDDGVGIDMQLRVDVCDQAWDETLHQSNTVPTYACAGNQHEVLGDTDLGDLIAGRRRSTPRTSTSPAPTTSGSRGRFRARRTTRSRTSTTR